jgi:acetyl esterase/lipase
VLHLHGGSFLFGSGRTSQCAFAASLLTSHIATFAFFPQYRLARKESGYFPAALQDAVTSYVWLVDVMGFEARKIIISGDGAGGALALGLVRWLGQQRVGVESPLGCLLWSPQLDVAGQIGENVDVRIRSGDSKADYLELRTLKWASELYLGPRSQQSGRDLGRDQLAKSQYVSPSRHPFATPIAVWTMVGKAEMLRNTIMTFAEIMSSVRDNTVGRFKTDAAPHNIFMMGARLGWKKQAENAAREAGMWLRKKGWTGAGRWATTVGGRTMEGEESERSGDVLFE